MSRHKRLVLTFDAFGTLFTPREPIGKQYVRTIPSVFLMFPKHVSGTTWINAPSVVPDLSRCSKWWSEKNNADPEVFIRPRLPEDMDCLVSVMIK